MSADPITEVTSESWGGRIMQSIKGIVFGLILFIVAFPLLFWNEGRAVNTYKTLKEGSASVISVAADMVDSANEGKLVHVSATAETDSVLEDTIFGVRAQAIQLARETRMYQWEQAEESETRKKVGGGTETTTTYSYNKVWAGSLIDSSDFKQQEGHENPADMPYGSDLFVARDVALGAFTLSESLIGMINNFSDLVVPADMNAPEALGAHARISNGGFYIGGNPSSPEVGDLRITFRQVEPGPVSLVAVQSGESFKPYLAKTGKQLQLLETGTHTAESMFEAAQASNKMLTWILRAVGFFVMFIGLNVMMAPFAVMADVLPILGRIVGAGTSLIAGLTAATLSLLTIAIAWIFYRPLLGITLIVVAVVLTVVAVKKLRAQEPAPAL